MVRIVTLFLLAAAGCSGISASYDFDPRTDFAAYKGYAWLPAPREERMNPLVRDRVVAAVDRALQAKGYRTSSSPDFKVATHAATENRVSVTDWGYGYWRAGGGVDVYQYQVGTLILDIVDAKTNRLVWRGTASGVVDPSPKPEETTKRINEAVEKMLANFPPPAK